MTKLRPVLWCCLSLVVAGSAGCSGGGAPSGPSGTGGGSTGGAFGGGGNGGTGGAIGSGGSGTGGSSGTGGVGTGGAAVADAGSGGMGDGAVAADSPGDTSGSDKNCAGNAISLSSNGTNKDSDAAQARVLINLMTDLPIGNANRTVEFWFYVKSTDWVGESNAVYIYGSPGSNATAFGLDFGTFPVAGMAQNHATLNPVTNGGFNVDSTAYLGITSSAAQWIHVAMTWDGTTMRTFVNGTVRITSTGTPAIRMMSTANSVFTLGCNPGNMNCFNGLFDELRIWKVARTDVEIMANYTKQMVGNEAGLVGYWKFDEAAGSATAADSVTTAGHTAHTGMLMATNANQRPTFVMPNPPAPIVCP